MYLFDIVPVFTNLSYDLNFAQKGGEVAEGLICIYNVNKFKLVESDGVVIAEELQTNRRFEDILAKISTNEQTKARLLDRKNVLQTVLLECTENGKLVLVANTHLYFHPNADHIRLMQGGLAILLVTEKYERLKQQVIWF